MRKIVLLAVAIIITACLLTACTPKAFFPEDGLWYCEDLKLYLSFEKDIDCYMLANGFNEECGWRSNRGSDWILIECIDYNCPLHELGDNILYAKRVSLDDTELTLKDKSGNIYVFVKVQ